MKRQEYSDVRSEWSCCALVRKRGGKRCPICYRRIRLAKVLRLLRHDARSWWWFQALRKQGRTAEAIQLERASIRDAVRRIREGIGRHIVTYRTSVIEYPVREQRQPFDLSVVSPYGGPGHTTCESGCHPGYFAAFVYCYANRIGLRFTAKTHDLV